MSYRLVGPFDFDLDAQVASARHALDSVARAVRAGDAKALAAGFAKRPGLYMLIEGEPDAAPKDLRIVGFWVVFGNTWMAKGPVGPPDREPPVAQALLDAATEEVWWENLPVASKKKGIWQPLIVLEWPAAMAWRAEVAPPGVPDFGGDDAGGDQDEPESWLSTTAAARPARDPREKGVDEVARYYANLPEERALVSVIRGSFKKTRALHTGNFQLLHPGVFGEGREALPFEEWVQAALTAKPVAPTPEEEQAAGGPGHGRPLALLGGAVAFPLGCWLTRTLGPWPPVFAEVRTGKLTDREVQVRWIQQARMALSSTVLVLGLVVGFTVGIRSAAQPRPRPVEAAPPPSPQPAMSVCSADNQKFVDEFRCQIGHLAQGGDSAHLERACRDAGVEGEPVVPRQNLVVEYCGLRDRSVDEWAASLDPKNPDGASYSWAAVAGAQACFNVLGYPHPYEFRSGSGSSEDAGAEGGRKLANPTAFLENEQLRIQPLVDLMAQLDSACDTYRGRLEARIEGAIFATHIGARGGPDSRSEPARLREMAVQTAVVGMNKDAKKCFEIGMEKGLSMNAYESMCESELRRTSDDKPVEAKDREIAGYDVWKKLMQGPNEGTLLSRYVRARFGPLDGAVPELPPLWECHLGLDGVLPRRVESKLGMWEIPIPVPSRYRPSSGVVTSQLQLDATLLKLRDNTQVDRCWEVVSKKLASYAPVHPLYEPLAEDGWPSPEQQLCGQICAAEYKVAKHTGPTPWVTPSSDLKACVTGEPLPRDERADPGRGRLDRLRMPWNYAGKRGWKDPSESHICSFNLIAQGRLPSTEGYIVSGFSPQQWAGEVPGSTRIAGYKDGLSVQAIVGMSRFGTGSAWSVASCGHVALQCFTGVMMDVIGDRNENGTRKFERYDWIGEWRKRVKKLSDEQSLTVSEEQPWCAAIQDYLSADEAGAQFDAPCRAGVEQARAHTEYAIRTLAAERD